MLESTIIWDDNQIPLSRYFDDVYFNTDGAVDETRYVFIEGNCLYERFLQHQQETFTIGETGFGSGLSFLVAWQTFKQFRQKNPNSNLKKLNFFSVEKYPLSASEISKIHDKVINSEDSLSPLAKQLQDFLIKSDVGSLDETNLLICYDDISCFADFLVQQNSLIDAWFFDGFSPAKNPDMWNESLFKRCYQLTREKGTFATFTAAGFVRRNLINAGFNVEKRKGFGIKREMLIGQKI
ncbi:tRNA (5-methylaminomethyl-2-thiouridine)(34)-methyltransferase MnmD [Gilliamella sp. W8126]|uniref:tRNA (5-methylaminomethyl-2-thiouridine)(34)-methyltransferase MnmD n=1 Tax=unclassified Gilliamella TaxID=2685620 RepID=UPI0018DECE57|nr:MULTISPECIES: tRNA (5-methylaminomethyl-2-thiouridine)(34)-methyltransferase MnmD [unclassified Gilliamella]MBI0006488.1 tRNA (5-methylaminomethyl-2-thiouridine)(34)-methyltransferase MnmD [Gilliamella sp. W8126]MBI0036814.1 tRNA (5-methylaminomethyl-2-thiouridine)(34)-methyltransferase MnmD [Gilliamella sp. B14384G10]MBI0039532.1 tRNA (5-methylaminomethyl-2-thiouridine)(34)-methyltransferase MnmD [Gilliamella sp. B14384G7]MBI0050809.1 tRNA (5-methylaminomethyl-2-thiouridine)(34)-methyltrans